MPGSHATADYPLLVSAGRRRRPRGAPAQRTVRVRPRVWAWRAGILAGVAAFGTLGLLVYHEHQQTVAAPIVVKPLPEARTPDAPLQPAAGPRATPVADESPGPAASPSAEVILIGDRWTERTLEALLVLHPELKLSDVEVAQLKEIYSYCQTVRTTYEAEVAELVSMDDAFARIRIPPYPEAGAKLEELWVGELSAELGAERFDQIDAHLGETFEVAFKGFGTSLQMLDVQLRRDPDKGLMYRIVARMDFYDPTGSGLNPLNPEPLLSTSARYDLRAETVATGEWRPLARHFPKLPE